jgi:hypothetical protein
MCLSSFLEKKKQLLLHEEELLAINVSLQNEIEERKASEERDKLLNRQLVHNNEHLQAANEEWTGSLIWLPMISRNLLERSGYSAIKF